MIKFGTTLILTAAIASAEQDFQVPSGISDFTNIPTQSLQQLVQGSVSAFQNVPMPAAISTANRRHLQNCNANDKAFKNKDIAAEDCGLDGDDYEEDIIIDNKSNGNGKKHGHDKDKDNGGDGEQQDDEGLPDNADVIPHGDFDDGEDGVPDGDFDDGEDGVPDDADDEAADEDDEAEDEDDEAADEDDEAADEDDEAEDEDGEAADEDDEAEDEDGEAADDDGEEDSTIPDNDEGAEDQPDNGENDEDGDGADDEAEDGDEEDGDDEDGDEEDGDNEEDNAPQEVLEEEDKVEKRCNRYGDYLTKMLNAGDAQLDNAAGFIESVVTSYTQMFNSDRRNPDRIQDITVEEMIDILFLAMQEDENFVSQDSKVRIPFIKIPNECPAEADLYQDLKDMKDELQDMTDLSNYILNPVYPIVMDVAAFFLCDNFIFADMCI